MTPLTKYISYAALLSCTMITGCSKSKNNATITSADSIKVALFQSEIYNDIGLAAVGDTVYFEGGVYDSVSGVYWQCYQDQTYSYLWNFGDGKSSTYTTPLPGYHVGSYHIYTSTGTYTTSMTVNDTMKAENGPAQIITICNDPLYTHLICQPRLWHGGVETIGTVTTNLPDSTFTLGYLDKVDISIWGDNVVYSTSLSSGTVLFFNIPTTIYGPDNSMVYYNVLNDSASFIYNGSTPGMHSVPCQVSYHSP